MGLIRAAVSTVKGTLADQWKEGVHCPAMGGDVILRRGSRMNQGKGSNTKGNPDVITNGSVILVEENTCMLTIDNGKITNIVTEPGQYVFDNSSAPSIFAGQIEATLKDALGRFTFGGTASVQQRVVYINLMPLPGIKFGTSAPVPYFDPAYNTSVELRFFGTYEVQVPDAEMAVKFYSQVANKGTASGDMSAAEIFGRDQYKLEFMQALKMSLVKLSRQGVRFSEISAFLGDLTREARAAVKEDWTPRGFTITNVAMGPATLTDESKALLGDRLKADTMLGGDVQRAMMAGSVARGIEAAAGNQGGAMMGFMGMNMASQMGGNVLGQFGEAPPTQQAQQAQQSAIQPQPQFPVNSWKCSCGVDNTGKFCAECGAQKVEASGWKCICGADNTGKFCGECGKAKPEQSEWICACGVTNSGKFCAECGKARA
ncbi:MAG: SPFH domain-containing protein [Oscillospiraceae bacterium]|nr:SPFH domain-containing protein [Oscillospiraceae bacterium]